MVPAVSQDIETGVMIGVPVRLNVKMITPGSGEIFVNTRALTEMDMQGSARLAAMVAGDITGKDIDQHDFLLTLYANSTIIGGPSAGGAMTVVMTALLEGLELRDDVMMTGMITLDGALGVVGGIPEKAYAAHLSGATYFLVPEGQSVSYNSTTYEDVNVTELAWERWNLTVVEVSDIREAVTWFTGLKFAPRVYPSSPVALESYQSMMRDQSEREIEEANSSLRSAEELLSSSNISEPLRSDLEYEIDSSEGTLLDAYDAYNQTHYYVASSKAFQSKISSRFVANYVRLYSVPQEERDLVMENIWTEAEAEISSAAEWVNVTDVRGITGLECFAAAQSRVEEAKERLEDSRFWYELQQDDMALFEASFATERALTATLWANMTQFFRSGPVPGPEDLKELAEGLFADASILATYADLLYEEIFGLPIAFIVAYIPEYAFIDPYASLVASEGGIEDERWAMATFEALESEIRSGLAIEFINVLVLAEDQEEANQMMGIMANKSRIQARIAIEDSRQIGVEPVLSVSRFEFSEDLATVEDISMLGEAAFGFRFARSAARLSAPLLDLYMPRLEVYLSNGSFMLLNSTVSGNAFDPNQDDLMLAVEIGMHHLEFPISSGPFSVVIPTMGISDGSHMLGLNLSDGSLFDYVSFNVIVDNNPPTILLPNILNETAYDHAVTLNLSVWDATDPNPEVHVELDGVPFSPGKIKEEGHHVLIVNASDQAGWTSEIRTVFWIDMTEPIIDLGFPRENGTSLVPPFSATWMAWDNATWISKCSMRVDSGEWVEVNETSRTILEGGWASWFTFWINASEGQHIFLINASDLAGNKAMTCVEFVLDGSPPEVRISGVTEGQWYDHPITVEFWVNDSIDPCPNVYAMLDGTEYEMASQIGPGRHCFELRATDSVGNERLVQTTFTIDIRPPEIWVNVTDSANYGEEVVIDFSVEEDLDPSPQVKVLLDGNEYGGEIVSSGEHVIELSGLDKAGNYASVVVQFVVDLSPPTIWVSVTNGTWYTKPLNLTFRIEDALDRDPLSTVVLDGKEYDWSEVDEGKHDLSIEAEDKAGNPLVHTLMFYVDLNPPNLSLSGVQDGSSYRHWILPSLDVVDAVDDSPKVIWSLNGESYTPGERIRDGAHELSVEAIDTANNSRRLRIEFLVDTIPPEIDLGVDEGAVYRGSITPNITVRDEVGDVTIDMYLDGDPYETGSKIGRGVHTLIVRATDSVGNTVQRKVVFTVKGGLVIWVACIALVLSAVGCAAFFSLSRRKTQGPYVYRYR